MVHGRIWLLGLYFELFPHNNNNNSQQALDCAYDAVKKVSIILLKKFNTYLELFFSEKFPLLLLLLLIGHFVVASFYFNNKQMKHKRHKRRVHDYKCL